MTFGGCLLLAIKKKGMTQKAFAEAVDLTTNYINQICQNRKKPTLEKIEVFCNVLSISLSELFRPMSATPESGPLIDLSEEEINHILLLRALKKKERDAVLGMASALSEEGVGKGMSSISENGSMSTG
jgi:transcriptional regulator with XRE-family HTH domain